jgi:hypothetical protein
MGLAFTEGIKLEFYYYYISIAEGRSHGEVHIAWIPGKTNPSDISIKEDKDVKHYEGLRDLMVKPRESVRNLRT